MHALSKIIWFDISLFWNMHLGCALFKSCQFIRRASWIVLTLVIFERMLYFLIAVNQYLESLLPYNYAIFMYNYDTCVFHRAYNRVEVLILWWIYLPCYVISPFINFWFISFFAFSKVLEKRCALPKIAQNLIFLN